MVEFVCALVKLLNSHAGINVILTTVNTESMATSLVYGISIIVDTPLVLLHPIHY